MSRAQVRVIAAQPRIGKGNSQVSNLGVGEKRVGEARSSQPVPGSMALSSPYAYPSPTSTALPRWFHHLECPFPPISLGQVQL